MGDSFTVEELADTIETELKVDSTKEGERDRQDSARRLLMLVKSHYSLQFLPEQGLSERVIFPVTTWQRNGIEDARFVRFRNDDGTDVYYATFTAFDGQLGMPQVLETSDFLHFRFATLNGPAVQNKGMALVPKKINGVYAMLSRQDSENIYLMFSDNVHFWKEPKILLKPAFTWELVQIGNCGSPIETAPLLLDEVTAQSDPERKRRMLDVLHALSADRQVILFSHDDEVVAWAASSLREPRDRLIRLATPVGPSPASAPRP